MDDAGGPQIMTLYISSLSGSCRINDRVPNQTATLKSYNIKFATDSTVLDTIPFLQFRTSFLSSGAFVNGGTIGNTFNITKDGITLPFNGQHTDVEHCDIDVIFSTDVNDIFTYEITSLTGADLSDFISLTLVFNYSKHTV